MPDVAIDPPLSLWYCDVCSLPIANSYEGTVSWADPTSTAGQDRLQHETPVRILIVHKGKCDKLREWPQSYDLNTMHGTDGMQWWASFLWRGPMNEPMQFVPGINPKPVMDLFYRLFIPYYEQARQHFNSREVAELLDGRAVYTEALLKTIIENSGN